ncbi:MAG: hypothetical protein SX243_17390 [Acidobacteriota bacterium]|nr:hypothetical protein [Acidobacteriota bacterium]
MSSFHDLEAQRIRQARQEAGETAVHPAVARLLLGFFLATLVLVPLVDQLLGGLAAEAASRLASGLTQASRELENQRPVSANRTLLRSLELVEDELEDSSETAEGLRPWAQALLTGVLGSGNEEALVGRDGWLFFRPDVEYLTGPGFLDPAFLEARRRGAESWQVPPEPDPRPALAGLAEALAERGISLLLVPAPAKPMAEPGQLSSRFAESAAPPELQNASWKSFRAFLEEQGIEVYEPAPSSFLRTDSHWTPESVDQLARELAEWIEQRGLLPPPEEPSSWRRREVAVAGRGDLATMLELPSGSEILSPEEVTLQRVETTGGEAWSLDPASPVLLLGDSFTNVFSAEHLGWGDSAGLAEQLSFYLGRSVDRISANDGGDLTVRRRLQGLPPKRFAPKRLVIYQLALRELAFGDWRVLEPALPEPSEEPWEEPRDGTSGEEAPGDADPPPVEHDPSAPLTVRGTIEAMASVPNPASTPYRDALVALRLGDLASPGGELPESILVYTWGMRDRRLTTAAGWNPGQELELQIVPWARVAPELETLQRLELDDAGALLLDAYWTPGGPP